MLLQMPAELAGNAADKRKNHGRFVLRGFLGRNFLLLGNTVQEGARITVGNQSRCDVLFLQGCALRFCDNARSSVIKTLHYPALNRLGMVRVVCEILVSVCRLPVYGGGKAAIGISVH